MTAVAVAQLEEAHVGRSTTLSPRRWWPLLAGLPAAAVSLAWAASKPLPMIDDWSWIAGARRGSGFVWSSRPGEALLHWLVFWASGTHPVPPLVVLALLNVGVGALMWAFASRHWGPRVATLAALAWAVLPNRGATRMWASCIPNLAAGALVLAAIVVADRERTTPRRAAAVIALAAGACLTYEGADALAAAAVVLATIHATSRRSRVATAVGGGVVLGACTAWVARHTPKTGRVHVLANASRLASTQFGIGLWPGRVAVLGVVMLAVIILAFAAPVLGRDRFPEEWAITVGVLGMALGASVFMVTGFPLADAGLFDRGNVFTDIGTSLVIGAMLALAWRYRLAAGAAVSAAVLLLLASGNVAPVKGFARSATDARSVLNDVRTLPEYPSSPFAIGPLPNHDGVAGFTAAYDIVAAIQARYGVIEDARVTGTDAQAEALVGKEAVYRYCPATRALVAWRSRC